MSITTHTTGAATRLLAALLPRDLRDRAALLQLAHRLDLEHGGSAARDLVLDCWNAWRTSGQLPAGGPLRDITTALGQILGGTPEPGRRPSTAATTDANARIATCATIAPDGQRRDASAAIAHGRALPARLVKGGAAAVGGSSTEGAPA